MTQRLPVPGGDSGYWGDILNGYLEVAHNADGTLRTSAVANALPATATSANALSSATTSVVVNGSAAPSAGQVLTASSSIAASWSTPTASGLGAAQVFTPTSVKTSSYSANPGDFIPIDASGGSVTITLPAAPNDKTLIAVKVINVASTNTVSINSGGTDVFNRSGGGNSLSLALLNQGIMLQYEAANAQGNATGIWYVQSNDLPLSQTDSRYVQQSSLGSASGVATLNSSSQLTISQLPISVDTVSEIAGGNIGATYTLSLGSSKTTQLTGTLTANSTITVSNLSTGAAAVLLLSQDSTGNRTLNISDGTSSQPVTIPTAANTAFNVLLWCPDGSTIYIQPGPQAGATGATGPQGPTGAAGGAGATGPTGPAGLGFGSVVAKTANYTTITGDNGSIITFNGTSLTATLPATPPAQPWMVTLINLAVTSLTISPNGKNLNGASSSLTIAQNQSLFVWSDGTNYEYGTGPQGPTGPTGASGAAGPAAVNSLRTIASGIQSEPYPIATASNSTLLTSGRIEGALIGLVAGSVINGIVIGLQANAAGLTLLQVAIYSLSGTLLASSTSSPNALNFGTASTGTIISMALSSTYTVPSSGGYYACLMAIGATPPALYRAAATGATNAIGSGFPLFVFLSGQSSLPASVTWLRESQSYWIGAY